MIGLHHYYTYYQQWWHRYLVETRKEKCGRTDTTKSNFKNLSLIGMTFFLLVENMMDYRKIRKNTFPIPNWIYHTDILIYIFFINFGLKMFICLCIT